MVKKCGIQIFKIISVESAVLKYCMCKQMPKAAMTAHKTYFILCTIFIMSSQINNQYITALIHEYKGNLMSYNAVKTTIHFGKRAHSNWLFAVVFHFVVLTKTRIAVCSKKQSFYIGKPDV